MLELGPLLLSHLDILYSQNCQSSAYTQIKKYFEPHHRFDTKMSHLDSSLSKACCH